MRVVVVDDEPRMVELIVTYLARNDIEAVGAYDGPSGLAAAREPDVDAVVLDLMLPGLSGLEVCRLLRREGNDVAILMLTARGAVTERVAGLDAGADDYVVKPFAMAEIVARLRAVRRRRESPDLRLAAGDVVLDREQRRVWVTGSEVVLPRREYELLRCLVENKGRVVSRGRLYDDVWSDDLDTRSNVLDVHMSRLRSHLKGSTVTVRTLRGVGYRLEDGAV